MADRKLPGLKAIEQARSERHRAKVDRWTRASPAFWLWSAGAIVAIVVGYRFFAGRQLDGDKAALLAKQRAVAATIGEKWFPLRDRIEKWTTDAAGHWDADHVDADASRWEFRSLPGLYLRLRVEDAKDAASVRKAAPLSKKDGFVACFLREPNAGAARGDADAGAFAEQPWNWQKAYAATRILTDEWTQEVKDAPDPLRLRVFEQQYESAVRAQIPLAIDLVQRAQFFLLVLDEDDPEAAPSDGGRITEEALQRVPHYARVALVDLRSGKELFRVRRVGEGSFVFAGGEAAVKDPETLDAMKRQVNNCALAKQVDAELSTPSAN